MDCCLCSSIVSIFRPPRNTICSSCYEGARCILALTNKLDDPPEEEQEKSKGLAPKGLAQAFNQLKQLKELDDALLEQYRFLEALVMAFHEELHPDVELVPKNGPPIHAHRVVMATKSSVFRSMFEADECKDPHTGPIPIPEMSHDELRCLLEFLYSGSISEEKIEQHGHALFIAADKYDIPFLSNICEAHISNSLNPSNVLDVLELATVCSATALKETAVNTIIKHHDEIIFTEKYEVFALRNALLSVEITKALVTDIKDMDKFRRRSVRMESAFHTDEAFTDSTFSWLHPSSKMPLNNLFFGVTFPLLPIIL